MTITIGLNRETALLFCVVWVLWSLANFLANALVLLVVKVVADWQEAHQEPVMEVSRHERTPSGGTVTEWKVPSRP